MLFYNNISCNGLLEDPVVCLYINVKTSATWLQSIHPYYVTGFFLYVQKIFLNYVCGIYVRD